MIKGRKWFAFFSHTGSEIYKIYKRTGIKPDKIITNLPPGDERINNKLKRLSVEWVYVNNRPDKADYERVLNRCNDCICTLHGWMRIVPGDICEEYEFYNLHPGLITEYPELRGKDPQARVLKNNATSRGGTKEYDKIGLVIHRVTEGVDTGPIIAESSCHNSFGSETLIIEKLKEMAVDTWIDVADILNNNKLNE